MGRFKELRVWNLAMEIVTDVYFLTRNATEINSDYGLKDQLQRSAVSIPSNIAEGDELNSNRQSIRHFYISRGSCAELITQLIIVTKVTEVPETKTNDIIKKCEQVSAMLSKLIAIRSQNL